MLSFKLFKYIYLAAPLLGSTRLFLAILGFFGFVNSYALLVNMSVAIVCMVNRTDASITEFNSSHINDDGCEQFSGEGNSSNVADIHRVGK